MKKLKEEKGITLIALIITIVVLLILAAVAIGTAQESNIVGYAQNAATKYEEAKNNELSLLSKYETELDKYATNKESATGGVKAYDFKGSIMIFTPENELYEYTNASDLFPSYKIDLIEVKIENDPTYNITIDTNDFTQEEISKIRLVTAIGMNGICAYFDGEDGRDTFYFTPVASGVTEVTITKDMPIQHSDELLAQYYHDSTEYEYYIANDLSNDWITYINYQENEIKMYAINMKSGDDDKLILISDINIEQNPAEVNIKIEGVDHKFTADDKRISSTLEDATWYAYIQEGKVYSFISGIYEGINIPNTNKMKFINILALPTE